MQTRLTNTVVTGASDRRFTDGMTATLPIPPDGYAVRVTGFEILRLDTDNQFSLDIGAVYVTNDSSAGRTAEHLDMYESLTGSYFRLASESAHTGRWSGNVLAVYVEGKINAESSAGVSVTMQYGVEFEFVKLSPQALLSIRAEGR
jgi:hypothetical protein